METNIDILAIGAHPDDVEFGCGGTLAKEILNGKKVAILDLTKGELGTRGTPEIRKQEASEARKILGTPPRFQLGFSDGLFINDFTHQLAVIKILRQLRPNIVICNAIRDRHIDHGKGSKLVSDSCFLSGLSKIDTAQVAWRPKIVYHYIQWENITPDVIVDISDTLDIKMKAVLAYKSQLYNPKSDEPNTPISTKNFLEGLKYRAQDLGRLIGVDAAEGFTVERLVAVNHLTDLI